MMQDIRAGAALIGITAVLSACSGLKTPGTVDIKSGAGARPSAITGYEDPTSRPYSVIAALPRGHGVETLQILGTRAGVTQRFLLSVPANARAAVILFAAGSGNLEIDISGRLRNGHTDFLIRSRRLFVRRGFAVATIDVPSDRKTPRGLSGGFRASPQHAADIGAVVAFLHDRLRLPVWLIGTGQGSTSVANGGIRLNGRKSGSPDGLVMSATVTVGDRDEANVLSMSLGSIRRPVLIAHHRRDSCRLAPYDNVAHLKRAMVGAPTVEVLAYDGGDRQAGPCQSLSHHGFLGNSRRVVADIAHWIDTLASKTAVAPSQ